MTSAQFLLEVQDASLVRTLHGRQRLATRRLVALAALLLLGVFGTGCSFESSLQPVSGLDSPYGTRQLWAIAPLRNESGITSVDTALVADLLAQEAQQVSGVDTVPVNRVLNAMRDLELWTVDTAGDARTLMNVLGVDGLIVGTVTAYDPYPPMVLGVAIELYHRDRPGDTGLDPVELTQSPQGDPRSTMAVQAAASQAAGVFRADNHDVRRWLEDYSAGRNVPDSALGGDIYLMSMELYTRFVSHQLMRQLLIQEQDRLQLIQSTMASTHRP